MKPVNLICPKCGTTIQFKNWFSWVWHSPFHWFGKRLTKCPYCGQKSYMKRRSNMIKTLYSIVPVDDGYHYLCKNDKGEYYLQHKAEDILFGTQLIFKSEEKARQYIAKNLDVNKYKVEAFGIEDSCYSYSELDACPMCGIYTTEGQVCSLCAKKYE